MSNDPLKPGQPPLRPPWDARPRYRQRSYNLKPEDLVGWSKPHVRLRLGRPDEKRKGAEWRDGPESQDIVVRDLSGQPARGFSFEPVPHTIPLLQAYEAWFYHNVQGTTWKLYLTRRPHPLLLGWFLPRVVVEVYEYPTGAVF